MLVVVVAILGIVLVVYGRNISPVRPHGTIPKGWYGWFDQSKYLAEARVLAAGDLPPKNDFYYPLGYPAVGAAGDLIGFHSDPFLPGDALALAIVLGCTAVVATRLRGIHFAVTVVGAVVFATPVFDLTMLPWSSTVTMVSVAVVMLIATSTRRPTVWTGALIGLAVGMAVAARLGDGLFVGLIAAVPLLRGSGRRIAPIAAAAVVGALLASTVLASQAAVFGDPLTTPYSLHLGRDNGISDQEAGAYSLAKIPRSFYEVFLVGDLKGDEIRDVPIVRQFPWALAAPVGLLFLFRRRHRLRGPMLGAAVASVGASLFYLSFRATDGASLKFLSTHYFKPWFPLWALLAAYGIAAGADALTERERDVPDRAGPTRRAPARARHARSARRSDQARTAEGSSTAAPVDGRRPAGPTETDDARTDQSARARNVR